MLKSIDVLLGLSVVMLMVSLVVTVLTQAVTNVLQTRGRNLLAGIASLLRQIHSELPQQVSDRIAATFLPHPLIKSAGSRYGTVIHREELTALLLELAAGDGSHPLEATAREQLCKLLKANGIEDPVKTINNVRSLVLMLEKAHPELSNYERYAAAFLQEAPSRFLSKMNGWFDQTIDRVSDRFTNSARLITFAGSLIVALVLQLDTAALVNRLSTDPALRQAMVERAVKISNEAPPLSTPAANSPAPGTLSEEDRQKVKNLQALSDSNVIDIPTGIHDWFGRWSWENWAVKLLGILLTSMLLSLGAPFWYNALKNLIRLRSMLAQKDDDQRLNRQTNTVAVVAPGGAVVAPGGTPVLITGERGDLGSVG